MARPAGRKHVRCLPVDPLRSGRGEERSGVAEAERLLDADRRALELVGVGRDAHVAVTVPSPKVPPGSSNGDGITTQMTFITGALWVGLR